MSMLPASATGKISMQLQTNNQALADFLRQKGQPSRDALERAISVAHRENQRLDRSIDALGLLEENRLLPLLAEYLSCEFSMEAAEFKVSEEAHAILGDSYLRQNMIYPVTLNSGELRLLTADPTNTELMKEIEFLLEQSVTLVVAPKREIRKRFQNTTSTENKPASHEQKTRDSDRLRAAEVFGPVIKFVNALLAEAVEVGASDAHFEATETGLRVRFRVNGYLAEQSIDQHLDASAIFARLKVLSGMNVTERRLPQDGRIAEIFSGRPIDFRVSSVPTQFGESIVCRILDPKALKRGWSDLGFDADTTSWITELIERPSGMFLVTGPTGAGKTTTLYTALAHLNHSERKIISVEDPIEYNLNGVEQIQVHEEIGLTFASALRSILRQDPNIIMIGEIRDEETAAIACRAALVGRMVLSTLHTNSAKGALSRLVDLGVPEYLVREVLNGVLSQELTTHKQKTRSLVTERWVP